MHARTESIAKASVRRTIRQVGWIAPAMVTAFGLAVSSAAAQTGWVDFVNETGTRLSAPQKYCSAGTNNGAACTSDAQCSGGFCDSVGATDPQEKDYAFGDVDQDGDIDLVCVRKEPFTSAGKRVNVFFRNEGGVLVDRTATYVTDTDVSGDMGFLTPTNDRDVLLVDLTGDGWLDIVTAVTISDGDAKTVGHPRIYRNKGSISGVWQGFKYENARIPTMCSNTGLCPPTVNPRFCSVAAGDLTGDGKPELWFGDYDSSGAGGSGEPANNDYNDRLLLNNGTGTFSDVTTTHFSGVISVSGTNYPFQQSAFGAAEALADMNGDGIKDIVKQTSLNDPRFVGVGYNEPASQSFFDTYESLYTVSPYFISVDDLNNDNKMDIVITDDGIDAYMLNTGNDAPVGGNPPRANFTTISFSNATDGFGSASQIVDLNNDGWKDVVIADVDVDIAGCDRTADILRNNADGQNVTFTSDIGNIPAAMLQGTHHFAVFDINGDGCKDMVVGRCSTTEVWMQVGSLMFTYPQGMPTMLPPGETVSFQVQLAGSGCAVPMADSGMLHLSINGGPFAATAMQYLGGHLYSATLPAGGCLDQFAFYFSGVSVGGGGFTDPSDAPTSYYFAVGADSFGTSFQDGFEASVAGWTIVNDPTLTGGAWQQAVPNGTTNGGALAAPSADAEPSPSSTKCFVTQNGAPGGAASAADVDGGPTDLISPIIDLRGTDAVISYYRWAYSSGTDVLTTWVANNGNNPTPTWVQVSSINRTMNGTANTAWEFHNFRVSDFVMPSANIRVRFRANDVSPASLVTEAGIDLFTVDSYQCDADCGDSNCQSPTEDFCNCPMDCPGQLPSEAGNCTDGMNNDCDGASDCSDSDCTLDPACIFCGDSICASPVENFCNCSQDCPGMTGSETGLCSDGLDNDCDLVMDCDDADCASDLLCQPIPTLSQWGAAALALLMLSAGTIVFRNRQWASA